MCIRLYIRVYAFVYVCIRLYTLALKGYLLKGYLSVHWKNGEVAVNAHDVHLKMDEGPVL